jgi:cytochrome b561
MPRYHPALVALHWLLALLIIAELLFGWLVLSETPNSDPTKVGILLPHMAIGMGVLALMLIRLVIRWRSAKPPEADTGFAALNRVGGLTHWVIYAVVIGMSLSGFALSLAAGLPDIVFAGSGDPLPVDFSAYAPRAVHGLLATFLGLLLALHIAAALYHQFIRKDGLFARMWFGARRM